MTNFESLKETLFNPPELRIGYALILAFAIVFVSIPAIVRMSHKKGLLYLPNDRSSHSEGTPSLGGIGIFAGIGISCLLFLNIASLQSLQYVIAGIMIIFMIGVKDDISHISPWYKLIGEVIACLVLVIPGHFFFTSIHGFMGHDQINRLLGIVLTLFVVIVITNSFNLIDGIDGLAGGLGVVIMTTFGIWFYQAGNPEVTIIAAAGIGSLLAFLWFNAFSKKYKIFMGDSGALTLGFVSAFFVILFNESNKDYSSPFHVNAAPAVSMAILALPLYDTFRVFFLRALRRQSPFHADRLHLHHMLLFLGLSHKKASLVLILFNIFLIALAFLLNERIFTVQKLTLVLLLVCFIFTEVINQLVLRKKAHEQKDLPPTQ